MISVALVTQNIENEKMLNPLPVQGFADNIAIVTDDERSLHEMISVSETESRNHAESNLTCKSIEIGCLIR